MLWIAGEPDRLSSKARAALETARTNGEGLAISDISLLEVVTLVNKGKIQPAVSLESLLHEFETGFVVLPITGRACLLTLGLPADYPKDPADRIIAATALAENTPLVTADRKIQRSKAVQTIW